MATQQSKVLQVQNASVQIKNNNRLLPITEGVSFDINKGETLGIVGESGCGKSITALSIMGLLPKNGEVTTGQIILNGQNLLELSNDEYRNLRGKDMSMIFQDPMTSLNPVYTVGYQISEQLHVHTDLSKKKHMKKVVELLRLVGIPRPEEIVKEYPHQLSGGMRQRVMIAMGLACNPGLLIADEPTTALDVTIQAQILELMKDLQDELDMSILFITHDLGVVAEICDRVIVMYAGQVVEEADVTTLFDHPKHPYTVGLMKSTPKLGEHSEQLYSIEGTVPQVDQMPIGCRFADRCPKAFNKCFTDEPIEFQTEDHSRVRCWLYNEKREEVTQV